MRRLAIAAALLAAACASPAPQAPAPGALPTDTHRVLPPPSAVTSVDLENAADGTKITLARGNELKVMLDANPAGTGTQWRRPKDFAPVLAQIGDRIYINKGPDARLVGAGGLNVFRFRAEQSGKVTLTFEFGALDLASPVTKAVRYEVTVE